MKERVTSFPFNTMSNPMYNGSTMVFLALALWSLFLFFFSSFFFPFFSASQHGYFPSLFVGESGWLAPFCLWWCLWSTGWRSPTRGMLCPPSRSFSSPSPLLSPHLTFFLSLCFLHIEDPSLQISTKSATKSSRRKIEGPQRKEREKKPLDSHNIILRDSANNVNHAVEDRGEPRFHFLLQGLGVS